LADNSLRDSRNRRSSYSIIADVLEVAKKGALKTQIMYRTNLSFSQLNKYLSLLLDRNLLEAAETSEKTTYKTTDKGLLYLRRYRRIRELLKKGKGNNPREVNLLHLVECGSRVIIAG